MVGGTAVHRTDRPSRVQFGFKIESDFERDQQNSIRIEKKGVFKKSPSRTAVIVFVSFEKPTRSPHLENTTAGPTFVEPFCDGPVT